MAMAKNECGVDVPVEVADKAQQLGCVQGIKYVYRDGLCQQGAFGLRIGVRAGVRADVALVVPTEHSVEQLDFVDRLAQFPPPSGLLPDRLNRHNDLG